MKLGRSFVAAAVLVACKGSPTASPEQLRQAHLAALKADDAEAAWKLLSPSAQAGTTKAAFVARWKKESAEHHASLEAAAKVREPADAIAYGGTTVHEGGRVLTWAKVDEHYQVVSGLPGRPRRATPAEAVRSLVSALRATDLGTLRALLAEELADALAADFEARADAIERALVEPGALVLSDDATRAELRYSAEHTLRLEQTPDGWAVTGLE